MPRQPNSVLDGILTLQLAVAWAGEAGEEPRLRWWRTDLAGEFGGRDLFERLQNLVAALVNAARTLFAYLEQRVEAWRVGCTALEFR